MRWFATRGVIACLLWPLSCLYGLLLAARRYLYQQNILKRPFFSVPIIVVGNITVGGTGKTPTVIALCQWLKAQGYQPGVVSRGYKGQAQHYPLSVTTAVDPILCGDEPWLIHQHTQCPVVVDPKRVRAVAWLLQHTSCDVVVSDDGLQHYGLRRTFEIALVNQRVGFGNGWLLPAGPLREPLSRLKTVDMVLHKSPQPHDPQGLMFQIQSLYRLQDHASEDLASWQGRKVHAVAGISVPQQFFDDLTQLGLTVIPHPFPDHYVFKASDFCFKENYPIIMTEKDATKCRNFVKEDWYVAALTVTLPTLLLENLHQVLTRDRL